MSQWFSLCTRERFRDDSLQKLKDGMGMNCPREHSVHGVHGVHSVQGVHTEHNVHTVHFVLFSKSGSEFVHKGEVSRL